MPNKLLRLLLELLNCSDDITEEYCNFLTSLIYFIILCEILLAPSHKCHWIAFIIRVCECVFVYVWMCVCTVWKTLWFLSKNLPIKFTMRKSAKSFECCSSSVVCCSSQGPATFLFFLVPATVKDFRIFVLRRWAVFQIVIMAFEMGSVPKDPIDVRHFPLLY